jgi:hypothetical protein
MSNDQQLARDWLRGVWRELLHEGVEYALQDAQEEAAADQIADRLWPALPPDDMVRLDQADPSLLRRGTQAVPAGFARQLERRLAEAAALRTATALPGNTHERGGRLTKIVRQEVARGTDVDRTIEWAFRERDTDDFTRRQVLREMVLRRLSTHAAQELAGLAPTDADAEPKRRLKILTALATPGGSPASRAELLRALTTGKTAAFPYVLKYIGPEAIPVIQTFPGRPQPTPDALPDALVARFPGAELVRECLRRYVSRKGVLTHFMNPDDRITDSLARAFEELARYVPRHPDGILMPKELALSESRRDRFRMPDGIACALGIATLTESLLRQAVSAKKWGGPKNARGGELVTRVSAKVDLARETAANLQVIFDQRSLSLRDAMAHAAFFADDEARVEAVVGGLSQTLASLLRDLAAAKVLDEVLAAPRWDAGTALDPAHLALIDEQYGPGLNIVDQLRDDEARQHVFKVLATATPDKRLMGSAGFLLWISGQRDEHAGHPFDDAQQFAALFGSLLTLEELLRALYEANGQRVLRVTPGGNVVRCHLAMLDDQPGELLERPRLETLFRHYGIEEKCVGSFLAVKAVRDLAFHGCWEALPKPWARYTHLVVKLIFTLCSIAHFEHLRQRPGVT